MLMAARVRRDSRGQAIVAGFPALFSQPSPVLLITALTNATCCCLPDCLLTPRYVKELSMRLMDSNTSAEQPDSPQAQELEGLVKDLVSSWGLSLLELEPGSPSHGGHVAHCACGPWLVGMLGLVRPC